MLAFQPGQKTFDCNAVLSDDLNEIMKDRQGGDDPGSLIPPGVRGPDRYGQKQE